MSTEEGEYIITHDDGNIEILDSAFINLDNISQMSFSFETPKDITESLRKKNSQEQDQVSVTVNGHIAYAPGQVVYPNKKESSKKIPLTGCIVQYREGIKSPKSRYGKDYVAIGVPQLYISKITSDARSTSSMNLAVKSTVQLVGGYYWFNCTLEKLDVNNTSILHQDASGNAQRIQRDIYSLLNAFEKSMTATILFTLSASAATSMMQEKIDLNGGTFNITMKPTEVVFTDLTDVEGPTLDDVGRRKNERLEATETLLASSRLAELAMRKLRVM